MQHIYSSRPTSQPNILKILQEHRSYEVHKNVPMNIWMDGCQTGLYIPQIFQMIILSKFALQ